MSALTLSDILDRGLATITVPAAGEVLGIGRDAAYAAAARGELPTLRLGRRLVVPVPRLLELLGASSASNGDAGRSSTEQPAPNTTSSSPQEIRHDHGDPQARVQSSNVRTLRP